MDKWLGLQLDLPISKIWEEMVQNDQINWRKKLKFDQKQVFPYLLKQTQNEAFSKWFSQIGQKEKRKAWEND